MKTHHLHALSMKSPPEVGDLVLLNGVEYEVGYAQAGYFLTAHGVKHPQVGFNHSIRDFIDSVRAANRWRPPRRDTTTRYEFT